MMDNPYGIVGVGGPLTVERLVEAYSLGVFPWPQGEHLLWFCPPERGVLFFDRIHVNKRLVRYYKNTKLEFTHNTAFAEVMEECSKAPRRGQTGTWITPEMKTAYCELHEAGYAHSFEVWDADELVGGLYGVLVNGVFSGESVFGHRDNVAKFCLIECVGYLMSHGHTWMDIQMVTPLTESFGGCYIRREEFLKLIRVNDVARK